MFRIILDRPISTWCVAFGLAALTGTVDLGCLGLDSHKRQPDTSTSTTDTEPRTCAGMSCWEPSPNTCAESGELKVSAPSGYCSGGDCFYATQQEECHAGICDEGVCVSTPCQGVTCIDPPPAFCSDAGRTMYAPSGYCTGGDCKYAFRTTPCEEACADGACVESPCRDVFCLKPPAPYCESDSNLIVFAPEGRCTVVGANTECLYDSQPLACDHGCQGGRCLDDPCEGVLCDRPPARHCEGAVLVVYEPYGVCDENGFCIYGEQRHSCIEPCVDAHCGEDDACTGSTCNAPPASYCEDARTLRVYSRDGWCDDGFCSYVYSDIDCPDGCAEGRCVGDSCLGVICDKPPASHCKGNVLIDFEQEGTCANGACSYQKMKTSCQDGCKNAKCLTGGDTDTDTDTDTDKDTSTETDGDTDTECSGQPDFTACAVVTAPDRSYDICVGGLCVSPGCGDASCNVPGPHFFLPDTNQRKCYNNIMFMTCPSPGQGFYGQDAQYGWDVTHNQSTRYTRTMPVTNQPIVEDNVAGLIWQGCAGGLAGSSCEKGSKIAPNWSDALAYCDGLEWGGHTDWRLPDPYELSSIVDSGRVNPAIDEASFPATSIRAWWSSSSYADNSFLAWTVYFEYGVLSPSGKNENAQVRCVRSGPFESPRFESLKRSGDRVVRDKVNNLEWQGCAAGRSGDDCTAGTQKTYTWKNALAYCEGLSYGGNTDWRLPSRIELQSIVDQRRSNPSIDLVVMFPSTPTNYYWSSSSTASNECDAWRISFAFGYVFTVDKGDVHLHRVRCVRSAP